MFSALRRKRKFKLRMYFGQIRGLIVILLFLAIIPLISLYSDFLQKGKTPFFADQHENTITIEISGKESVKGIYFVKSGFTAGKFFNFIGCDLSREKDFPLENGMKLTMDSKSQKKVAVSSIDNSSRLALGMRIDLNRASEDDLLLIPGIGEATAKKILDLRNKKIFFKKIEELMEIKGIKEKKLAKLKQYLFIVIKKA